MSAREDIAFLVGSEVRIDLLQRLRSAPARPSDLADRCSCARETAQRTVSGFADRGWAEKVADTDRYRLTHAGEMIAGSYAEFEERLDVATRFRHLLENLDGPVDGLTCELLAETARTRATPENPHAPVNRLLELMDREHIATLRGMTPIVSRVFNQAAAGVIGPETDADLIVDRDVLDASARRRSSEPNSCRGSPCTSPPRRWSSGWCSSTVTHFSARTTTRGTSSRAPTATRTRSSRGRVTRSPGFASDRRSGTEPVAGVRRPVSGMPPVGMPAARRPRS